MSDDYDTPEIAALQKGAAEMPKDAAPAEFAVGQSLPMVLHIMRTTNRRFALPPRKVGINKHGIIVAWYFKDLTLVLSRQSSDWDALYCIQSILPAANMRNMTPALFLGAAAANRNIERLARDLAAVQSRTFQAPVRPPRPAAAAPESSTAIPVLERRKRKAEKGSARHRHKGSKHAAS